MLDATRELLAAGGMEALSMRAVAERVGVSATAIYHHFANKQALVDRVVNDAFVRFGAEMEQAALAHPTGSLERVQALGRAYVRFAVENETYFRVIFNIAGPNPRELEELPHGAGYPFFRQSIVDAMAAGAMRQADPDIMAHYLWAHVHGIVTLALSCRLSRCPECEGKNKPAALELLDAFGPLLRGGIAGPASRPGDDS
ncbi:MAG: TetR/AcrR family transcriptional regulator [Gemmatimonadota bacterium]|nr:TetR/AcrR family transcriptional regulator [Gemmatimonadota bacterium]MDH4351625.1 TetR/AcrR family transcriptional regulator [Gemmatimonadota bacterium]MDH5197179.1 TetR/AcrR family transcriptional regulator [Gemmatimonadota bacterium]